MILAFSQSGTSSPYSFYGIGSKTFKGSIDNRSMGGLSVYTVMGIPCITLRDNTERPETISEGTNELAGASPRYQVTLIAS